MRSNNDLKIINFVGLDRAKKQYSERKQPVRSIFLAVLFLILLLSWVVYK